MKKSNTVKFKKANKSHNLKIEKLYILPGLEEILCPDEKGAEVKSSSEITEGMEHQKGIHEISISTASDTTREPFHIWQDNGKTYSLDGRIDEYHYALQNNIKASTVEHKFKSIYQARNFAILSILKSPQLNAAQRCLMALELKKNIAQRAAKNKGRRSDLKDDSSVIKTKINTNKELGKIAGVGEQYVKHFSKVLKQGPDYFGKKKAKEYIFKIINETMSVNSVHRKLQDCIKIRNDRNDFVNEHKNDILLQPDTNINEVVATEDVDDAKTNQTCYGNPAYENDFYNKIICGNNLDVLKKIPDNSVNLIFGSPPYNVPNVNYKVPIPIVNHETYIQQIVDLARECYRIARIGSRFVINIAPTRGIKEDREAILETFIISDIVSAFEKNNLGWKKRNVIIWNKGCAFQKTPKGAFSARNPYFVTNHEYLIVFYKGTLEATAQIEGSPRDLARDEYVQWGQSVWNIVPQSKSKGNHPCPFPEPLAERTIKMLSFVGDVVVDPWVGTGTTTAVAAKLGRRWFGCDIAPEYCKNASVRTEKAQKKYLDDVKQSKNNSIGA